MISVAPAGAGFAAFLDTPGCTSTRSLTVAALQLYHLIPSTDEYLAGEASVAISDSPVRSCYFLPFSYVPISSHRETTCPSMAFRRSAFLGVFRSGNAVSRA